MSKTVEEPASLLAELLDRKLSPCFATFLCLKLRSQDSEKFVVRVVLCPSHMELFKCPDFPGTEHVAATHCSQPRAQQALPSHAAHPSAAMFTYRSTVSLCFSLFISLYFII